MNEKTVEEKRHHELLAAIESVKTPLNTLALLEVIREIYSPEERARFVEAHRVLRDKSSYAHKQLMEINIPGRDLGYEARVAEFGEDVAKEHLRPYMEALEHKKIVDAQVAEFEISHPLIAALHRMQQQLVKKPWESSN